MQYSSDVHRESVRKLRLAIVLLLVIVVFGVLGFIMVEEYSPLEALYMTVITLSTVGFGEVRELDAAGRVFAIILIGLGVSLGAYTLSIIGQIVLEGQLREFYGRRKMRKRIENLSDHIILAGYGRVGRRVAREFAQRNAQFVVIEMDAKAVEDLVAVGHLFVEGSATDDDVLREAGIDRARTLISTLPDEAQNVYITLTARYMNKDLNIIARADLEGGERKLLRAGANHIVSPHILGGQRMAMASLRPNVVDFMHTAALGEGGLSIEEMVVPSRSGLAGKTLADSRLKQDYNVTVIGIKKPREQMSIAPGPSTIMDEGDILVLIGPSEGLERLENALRGNRKQEPSA